MLAVYMFNLAKLSLPLNCRLSSMLVPRPSLRQILMAGIKYWGPYNNMKRSLLRKDRQKAAFPF